MIPETFRSTGAPNLINYDWQDVADGTGIIHFKGAVISGGNILTTQTLYSNTIETFATAGTSTSYVKLIDLDFDLSAFNTPRTIKGKAIVSFGIDITRNDFVSHKFIAKIRKYSGTTETEICNGEVEYSLAANWEGTSTMTFAVPETSFKKGDILRLTMEGWSKDDDGDGGQTQAIGHDPMNRDGTHITPSTVDSKTSLDFYCPFEVSE